jgi:signal transduction histidine kinase/ligand-binding sensor domain-containing protein/DNA-binding NarL/FixJ family response regulator
VKVGTASLLLVILLCQAASASGSPHYQHQAWTVDDGLPVNAVNALLQGRSGYLWLATNDGLVRFDGIRFTVFNTVSHPEMQSNRILGLVEGPDGALWWWTEQMHLVSMFEDRVRHYTEADGLPSRDVQRIVRGRGGRLWFATRDGLAYLEGGSIRTLGSDAVRGDITWFQPMDGGDVWFRSDQPPGVHRYQDGVVDRVLPDLGEGYTTQFMEAQTGELLLGNDGRVWRHDGETMMSLADGWPDYAVVSSFGTDPSGRHWAITQGQGVFVLNDGIWALRMGDVRTPRNGRAFLHDAEGGFWIVTDHAVYRDGERVFRAESEISDALIDDEGNVWLSLFRGGLKRLQAMPLRTWGQDEGLPEPNIYPVVATSDGSVWVGSFGAGPARWVDGRFETGFALPNPSIPSFTLSLIERRDGSLLACVTRQILRLVPGRNRFEAFEPANDREAMACFALYEDRLGRLWAGTDKGVFVLEGDQWQAVLDDERSQANYVRHFAEAPDGSLWMATNGQGILILRDGEVTRIGRAEGLVSDNIRALWFDPAADGTVLWVGSEDSGLQRLAFAAGEHLPHSIATVQQQHGLFDNVIHVILPDGRGRLWMNSNRGIFWVDQAELEAFAAGELYQIQSIAYGPEDGLRNREGNGGIQPAGAVDERGVLWFPTQAGLVQVDPARVARNLRPARPVIESVSVHEALIPHLGNGTLDLARDERDIRIGYTGISLADPEGVQFRYRLAGYDRDWYTTTGREAVYTNLPSGEHRFELLAANGDGVWSDTPVILSLQVAPHLHETLWFRSLLVLGLGLAMLVLLRWQAARSRQHQRELERQISERTHQLRQEKERTERQARDLRQLDQARTRFFTNISHEFRTPLTLIMGPIQEFLRRDEISTRDREGHEMVLRNSRYLLRLVNQILDLARLEAGEIQLQAAHGDLAALVRDIAALFEPICQRQEITFSVKVEPESILLVFDEQRMEQVVANLLSNAIKFTPAGGEVRLELGEQGDTIKLAVIDTGIGIAADEQALVFKRFYQADTAQSRSGEGTGVGLSLVKNLVELHGGNVDLQSAPGNGSRFTILLERSTLAARNTIKPPTRSKADSAPEIPIEVTQPVSDLPQSDRPLILVADDNADMRVFIRNLLSGRYRVVEAADGREAFERCREALPDLVMLDVMMPEMDGFAAGRAIQSDHTLRGIPMLFLTARGDSGDRLEGLNAGAVAYLTKPFEPGLLQAQVDSLIAQQMHLRERLRQAAPKETPKPTDPFQARLIEALSDHFMDADFGVAELADAMHLDRSQLFRRIKKGSGLSPSQCIQHFRLDRAAELLESGSWPSVSQVAYACGFNSLSWFSKCFRERFGRAPGDYCR